MKHRLIGLVILLSVLPQAAVAAEWPYRAAQAWYLSALGSDYATTKRNLDSGKFIERNPLVGELPDNEWLAGCVVGTGAIFLYGARTLREKGHRRAAIWLLIGAGLVHAYAASYNQQRWNVRGGE